MLLLLIASWAAARLVQAILAGLLRRLRLDRLAWEGWMEMKTELWKRPKVIAYSLVVLLLLIVIFQNTGVVTLRLLFWRISMSLALVLPLILLTGFGMGFVAAKLTGGGKG